METKTNKFQKIINFILKYGLIIVSVITLIIGIISIFITAYFNSTFYHPEEKTYFKYSIGIVEILFSILAIAFIALLDKKIFKKVKSYFLIIPICIISFAVYIIWINAMRLNPETDQKLIHDMAVAFLDGNINNFTGTAQYLFLYPYQFGITFLVSIIYKIFGQNFLYVEYLNAICSIINMILIFYISKLIFKNENIQKILSLLLCGFSLYWMFFNVHFYGNIIGLTLALFATLFTILYLDKNKFWYLLLTGIFISLSIIIKTNYNIFLCGIIIVLLLDIIQKWNLKNLLIIPIFLIGYLGINIAYSNFFENTCNLKLSDGVPMISFIYMGMSEPTDLSAGWYNGITADIFRESNYDIEKASEESITLINDRINYFAKNPQEFIKYYSEKIGSTWLNPTFQTIWCSLPGVRYRWYEDYANYISYHSKALSMVGGNLEKVEENYFNIYQIIIFIFAGIGIFKNSKDLDLKKALLPIIFIGGFLFHILWETKAIYVIQYYFILLPYAAFGLNYFFEKIYLIWKNRKDS
jgi:hypothetical protein